MSERILQKQPWLFGIGGLLLGLLLASAPAVFTDRDTSVAAKYSSSGTVIGVGQTPSMEIVQDVEFKQFWEVWQLLKAKYYEQPVQDKTLFYGALAGMTAGLGDPYTNFFEPQIAEEFQQALSGNFEGIGAEIGIKDEQLRVVAPLPETPAEKAGLQPGDLIVKIDKQETVGMSVEKAVSLIRGPKGTNVTLSLVRPKAKTEVFEVTITRARIQIHSVKSEMLEGKIAYIEVSHFNEDTKVAFRDTVTKLLKQDPKAIILDLRNNPGGFLDASLSMAGEWVGDATVVKERRQGKIVESLAGTERGRLGSIPTIVLVNQGSASASEIVAGALKDHGKAKILGQKTFGKGSIQDYQNFSDGSGIKITIAEWVTPHEHAIHTIGLEPDILVERTPEDYEAERDPQLDRAVEILSGKAGTTEPAASSTAPGT
jgi:carboxyl-terminal processing protease